MIYMNMKKILFLMTAVVAVLLISCNHTNEYQAKGEALARQLDEACQAQDMEKAISIDEQIRAQEKEIAATGDSVAVASYREALKETRERNAPFVASAKLEKGKSKDDIVKEAVGDVMEGDVNINSLTESIDAMLEKEKDK